MEIIRHTSLTCFYLYFFTSKNKQDSSYIFVNSSFISVHNSKARPEHQDPGLQSVSLGHRFQSHAAWLRLIYQTALFWQLRRTGPAGGERPRIFHNPTWDKGVIWRDGLTWYNTFSIRESPKMADRQWTLRLSPRGERVGWLNLQSRSRHNHSWADMTVVNEKAPSCC